MRKWGTASITESTLTVQHPAVLQCETCFLGFLCSSNFFPEAVSKTVFSVQTLSSEEESVNFSSSWMSLECPE